MPKFVFLDLETTGLEEKDRICELALIFEENEKNIVSTALCKGPQKISKEAMSLHHITNEMIVDAQTCQQSDTYKLLQECNTEDNVLIAHNVDFDLRMLEKEGFDFNMKKVDTLRCVKALIPECEKFNLQFLRYELDLYKEETELANELGIKLSAHRALSDSLHLMLLWKTLLQYATVSQLIEISAKPVLLDKLPFGKYGGRYIEEIVDLDMGYLYWMLENIDDMDEDLKYSIRYHMKELG
jgi:DNA polymerase-3 subunit epsilon/exodeoxyribonuclease X